jgi:hypothetical protein
LKRIIVGATTLAGASALAVTLIAAPAFASIPSTTGSSVRVAYDDATPDPTATDPATTDTTPDPTTTNDSTSDGTTDDSTTDDSTTDDSSTDDSTTDDSSTDDSTTGTTTTVLPDEKGKPKEALADQISIKKFKKSGITVVFSGLTKGDSYQPYFSTSAEGDTIGGAKKASSTGVITVVWKPGKTFAVPAQFNVGLAGNDTNLNIRDSFKVRYGTELSWSSASHRDGKSVTLTATVKHDNTKGKATVWSKAVVKFQEKVGSKWKTVKTDKSNSDGVASVTVKAGKHSWRAIVAVTKKYAADATGSHKK